MRLNMVDRAVQVALGVALLLLDAFSVQAQTKRLGARYGSREPMKCSSMVEPTRGAPSAAQAAQYVKCTMEGESTGPSLVLLQDVIVQVAPRGRAYNSRAPISNVDPDSLVYDIRGSYVRYACDPAYTSASGSNVGKNCYAYDHLKAQGVCWKTTFGDWGCNMVDPNGTSAINQRRDQAPPQ